jgi:hypothetical protein
VGKTDVLFFSTANHQTFGVYYQTNSLKVLSERSTILSNVWSRATIEHSASHLNVHRRAFDVLLKHSTSTEIL